MKLEKFTPEIKKRYLLLKEDKEKIEKNIESTKQNIIELLDRLDQIKEDFKNYKSETIFIKNKGKFINQLNKLEDDLISIFVKKGIEEIKKKKEKEN